MMDNVQIVDTTIFELKSLTLIDATYYYTDITQIIISILNKLLLLN